MNEKKFCNVFKELTGYEPLPWQINLFSNYFVKNELPKAIDLPTGLGKTMVIAIWLIARSINKDIPGRLVYVVNRRTVVDQTTAEVEKLRDNLKENPSLKDLLSDLGLLAISTLRGQFADNNEWSANPSRPAVICGTVDMIGSRLLFSGYRIGFKARPLHAGFLGQDVLLVHDEAHLEPAFQELIETIQKEQQEVEKSERLPWPKLQVMSLSATTRNNTHECVADDENKLLGLTDDDSKHPVVQKRVKATKTLALHPCDDDNKKLVEQLVDYAIKYKESSAAILLFARSVDHAETVTRELKKALKKEKLPENVAPLTGTLRGLERDKLVNTPVFQRFLPKSNRNKNADIAKGTVYLVCTSAGEVGVNISADHLVCDLSTFDSMAQRFGRVNRFGECDDTRIDVVHPTLFGKKGKSGKVKISEFDERRQKTLELLEQLEQLDGNASPLALSQLDAKDRYEAFAPEPTILPATDILFDAWSLTTIRSKMPGRPPVEPYLHGVAEWEPPQTQVAWREEVEVLDTDDLLERYQPQDLLEAYPLKPHELLRDRSDRVLAQLRDLIKEPSSALKPEIRKKALERVARNRKTIIWIVGERSEVERIALGDYLKQENKKAQPKIENRIVLLPPSVGGLNDGLLDGKSEEADDVADKWCGEDDKPRRWRGWDDAESPEGVNLAEMALVRTIDINPDASEFDSAAEEDSESSEPHNNKRFWHWYALPRDAENATRASTAPITWNHHTGDVVSRAKGIVEGLNWSDEWDDLKQAIFLTAEYHDLGKKRELWQRSIGNQLPVNPEPEDWLAKSGGNKKSPGFRTDYRHEFGSLLDVLDAEQEHFTTFSNLSDDMQELVLHMIAAHHGRARPHFPENEVYDPESGSGNRATEQALETPRRFARLQRKYGRWGLAYLESLLRAADWAASAEPSEIGSAEPVRTEERNRS